MDRLFNIFVWLPVFLQIPFAMFVLVPVLMVRRLIKGPDDHGG